MRLGLEALGNCTLLVVSRSGHQNVGERRLGDSRRPIEDEGRSDLRFVHQHFGLQQLELEADRTEILPKEELRVLERKLVGCALGLRAGRHMASGFRIDLGVRENALGRYWIVHSAGGLADQSSKPKRYSNYSFTFLGEPQSTRLVPYMTPASAAKSSSEPISSEKASRLSRM